MPPISFSLTEQAVIDPILTLRAPLSPLEPASWTAHVWQGIQSELIARVMAVFTSVFAAADTLVHLATGVYKGVCLLARVGYNKSIVYAHFRQAAWFAGLTVVGSIAGVIWPGIFKRCRYSPPSPSNHFPDAPLSIQKLARDVQTDQEQTPFTQLRQFWKRSSLEDKHWFVRVFSHNSATNFEKVRPELAGTVYRHIQPLKDRQVKWLSSGEIDQQAQTIWKQTKVCNRSFFYHATSEQALESILKSKRVEVRHEKAFRGAFVSTQPETGFGRCILAFERNIERLSSLTHGFEMGQNTYWAGFSRDIPVTGPTLAYIMLHGGTVEECQALETRCQQWTGRPIQVLSLYEASNSLASVQALGMGIPFEWPRPTEDDNRMGQKILNTLRARALVQVKAVAQVRTRAPVAARQQTQEHAPQMRLALRQQPAMAMGYS